MAALKLYYLEQGLSQDANICFVDKGTSMRRFYSKHKSSYAGSDYAVIDSKGRILERGPLSEDIAHNGCKPVLFNGKYVWMVENNSGGTEGIMYGDKTTNYFYELQVK